MLLGLLLTTLSAAHSSSAHATQGGTAAALARAPMVRVQLDMNVQRESLTLADRLSRSLPTRLVNEGYNVVPPNHSDGVQLRVRTELGKTTLEATGTNSHHAQLDSDSQELLELQIFQHAANLVDAAAPEFAPTFDRYIMLNTRPGTGYALRQQMIASILDSGKWGVTKHRALARVQVCLSDEGEHTFGVSTVSPEGQCPQKPTEFVQTNADDLPAWANEVVADAILGQLEDWSPPDSDELAVVEPPDPMGNSSAPQIARSSVSDQPRREPSYFTFGAGILQRGMNPGTTLETELRIGIREGLGTLLQLRATSRFRSEDDPNFVAAIGADWRSKVRGLEQATLTFAVTCGLQVTTTMVNKASVGKAGAQQRESKKRFSSTQAEQPQLKLRSGTATLSKSNLQSNSNYVVPGPALDVAFGPDFHLARGFGVQTRLRAGWLGADVPDPKPGQPDSYATLEQGYIGLTIGVTRELWVRER